MFVVAGGIVGIIGIVAISDDDHKDHSRYSDYEERMERKKRAALKEAKEREIRNQEEKINRIFTDYIDELTDDGGMGQYIDTAEARTVQDVNDMPQILEKLGKETEDNIRRKMEEDIKKEQAELAEINKAIETINKIELDV